MRKTVFALAALAATALATPAAAAELVTNGNFSAGLTGFNTTYSTTNNPPQGQIIITTNPSLLCGSCFVSIGDHTTGTGNMLFADGASANTGAFWSQSFAVAANSNYLFSFWATNAGTTGPLPVLRASINGANVITNAVLGPSTGNTATTWNQYTANFSSGANTAVTLALFDDTIEFFYNDFAVDDISFVGPAAAMGVPEPSTWAMLIAGIGLVGAGLRRRRKASSNDVLRTAAA